MTDNFEIEYNGFETKISIDDYVCGVCYDQDSLDILCEEYPSGVKVDYQFDTVFGDIEVVCFLTKDETILLCIDDGTAVIRDIEHCLTDIKETLMLVALDIILKYPELKLTIEKYVFPLIAESK